jgi:polysaccharide pyruvyl transferase WcaK-like protein
MEIEQHTSMGNIKQIRHFLLVGNGPYLNRGCEAIVRGTMAILRHEFGENFRVTLATYEMPDVVSAQAANETDPLIKHVALIWPSMPRWSAAWCRRQLMRPFVRVPRNYSMLDPFCSSVSCAMQIGGDNFSLDYGLLTVNMFMGLNDDLHRRGLPIILWGASVGPFEPDSSFEQEMFAHLRRLRAIMLRETDSYQYLHEHGVEDNLCQMSDPAFVMDPVEPPANIIGCIVPPGAIGLNLSPLMARYVTGGDMDAWVHMAADIVQSVVSTTGRQVILIPHVTWPKTDDRAFMRRVIAACPAQLSSKLLFVTGDLSAAELKWVISQCEVFAGARTHSTIAAISSCVPTLSLAYSRKARALNQDVFGKQVYCLQPSEVTPVGISQRIAHLLVQNETIRHYLALALPSIKQKAFAAGANLRQIIESL